MSQKTMDDSSSLKTPSAECVGSADVPDSPTPCLSPETTYEVIEGFQVHPVASLFELLTGEQFDDLVGSVIRAGTVASVEFHNGLLTDGRNRVRAVEEARRQGHSVEMPTHEWVPLGQETIEEHILTVNLNRRHLTDDQRVAIMARNPGWLNAIRESRRQRQVATRFGGNASDTVSQNPAEPCESSENDPRPAGDTSTRGQVASLLNFSTYRSEQLQQATDGLADGSITVADLNAVAAGEKKMRNVLPRKRTRRGAPKKHGHAVGAVDGREKSGVDNDLTDDFEPTEEAVNRRLDRWMAGYAIADHREVRRIVAARIERDQREFDRDR